MNIDSKRIPEKSRFDYSIKFPNHLQVAQLIYLFLFGKLENNYSLKKILVLIFKSPN